MLDFLPVVFSKWGYDLKCCRPDLNIVGSPERALKREVLEDTTGALFVLEKLMPAHRDVRELQAQIQQFLANHGVELVHPWISPAPGKYGVDYDGSYWQLRRWTPGVALPRETYAMDDWRGKVTAEFMISLRKASMETGMPGMGAYLFSLMHYIDHLMEHFQRQIPELVTDMKPMIAELHDYHEYEHKAPARFCHGDLHPGNIIWGEHGINAVIDWEFCGPKTATYDAANLLGCIGMDDPAFLTGPYAMTFVKTLKEANFFTPEEWHFLPDQIAALRFGWMREWVARKDKAMMTQELDFIWLILDNRELLRNKWM